jgi:hypothetical protein
MKRQPCEWIDRGRRHLTDGVAVPDRDLANVAPIDHRSRVAVSKDGTQKKCMMPK